MNDLLRVLHNFVAIHGGTRSFVRSPFLLLSCVFTFFCFPLWLFEEFRREQLGDVIFQVVPSMLGFSLGGMAILLAFSSPSFVRQIRQGGKPDSLFMKTIASFFFFIMIQTATLLIALLMKGNSFIVFAFCVTFLLIYSIFTAFAIAFNLFDIARIFNAVAHFDDREKQSDHRRD